MKQHSIETSPGVRIAVRSYGELQGTALVISPGLGATHEQWEADAEYFSRILPCVIVDLRGHGSSSTLVNPTRGDLTLELLGADCAAVCAQLDIGKIHFLGNSLGGLVGLEMIRQGAPVRSLTTCGTVYELHFSAFQVRTKHFVQRIIGPKRMPDFLARTATTNPLGQEIIRSMYSKVDWTVTGLIDWNIADYNYLDVAKMFDGPIHIVRGSRDKAINQQLPSTLEALGDKPGFLLSELEGAGHFANLDDPGAFRAAVETVLENFIRR